MIKKIGKKQFKTFVRNKMKEATLRYLQEKKAGHSKVNSIGYSRPAI